jgi:hypothetical protein
MRMRTVLRICKETVCDANITSFFHLRSDRGQALAENYGVPFFEVSAKDGSGVQEAFAHLGRMIIKARDGIHLSISCIVTTIFGSSPQILPFPLQFALADSAITSVFAKNTPLP